MLLGIVLVALSLVNTKPTEADAESNGHHGRKFGDLSDQDHYGGDHHDQHNPAYDRDAFLGDEANEFDDLTPEQSKEKLAIIFDKIDKDQDGFVSEKELQDWIVYVQSKYIDEDTQRQWSSNELDGEEGAQSLKWDTYKRNTYGFDNDAIEGDDYAKFIDRDKVRWDKADLDGNGEMSAEEFRAFLHPEDAPHMHDIIIDETLEDIDKDHDGYISLQEYLDFMHQSSPITEEHYFRGELDRDGSELLDRQEILHWITIGYEGGEVEVEAAHLVANADTEPKDKKLSKEEVLDKYDLFVGSQATDFGDALYRHDEF